MKIKEIISEAGAFPDIRDQMSHGRGIEAMDDEFNPDDYGQGFDDEELDMGELDQPEMNLSSNADTKMINAVKKVCDSYKGQGHAQVELLPFLTKVIEIAKKPVNLADLIAINKKSREIQSMIDSIDEKKVKFKNMSVKNEDPNKAKEDKNATVDAMASRATGRSRGV